MNRTETAVALVAPLIALAATSFAPNADARPKPVAYALSTRESLRQSLAFRPSGPQEGVTVRETRRLRASLNVLVPALDPAAVDGNTYVGLRIGDWTFERPVSFDRAWKAGRTRARFRVASTDAKRPGVTTVNAEWSGGVLSISVVSTSEAPIAAANVGAAAGSMSPAIDGAARIGAQHVHLGGAATGIVARRTVPVLDAPTSLSRVDLVGAADVVADTTDSQAPSIAITAPVDGATAAVGTVHVTGTVGDDRTIASVSHVLDFGAETSDAFALEPSSGYLDDVRGTFAFDVAATPGLHALTVYARDIAGNSKSARTHFLVPQSGVATLRASGYRAVAVDDKARLQSWGGSGAHSPRVDSNFAAVRAAVPKLVVRGDGTVWTTAGDPIDAPPTGGGGPVQVQGLDGVVDVAMKEFGLYALALRSDGVVLAWGENYAGQLGDGSTTPHYPPAPVQGLPSVRAIAAGDAFGVALDFQGDVWTWGFDGLSWPQTGDVLPRKVAGPSGIESIAVADGGGPIVYAVATDGSVWNWGWAMSDVLAGAEGTYSGAYKSPGKIVGIGPVAQAALGRNHVLLAMRDGTVLACGGGLYGDYGQLGDGTTTAHYDLRPVPGLADVVGVAAGQYTSFAVLSDGSIRAFGLNSYGSLGDGTTTDRLSPVVVTLSQ